MTETQTPFQNARARARNRQALVTCCICQLMHPVDITQEGERLILKSDRVRYDAREGFICASCTTEHLTEAEARGVRYEHMADVLALLRAHPEGLTARQIATETNLTRQTIGNYLPEMLVCRVIERHKVGYAAAVYRAIND